VIGTANVLNNFAQFIDNQADVSNQTNTYQSKYIDTCGNIGAASNSATSILASGIANDETQINLVSWTPYLGFEIGVDHYEVYRIEPGGLNTLVGSVPSSQLSIEDSVDSGSYPGEICYQIEAHEIPNNYGITEICNSNQVCLIYQPIIYIPNSIFPDGINSVFVPIATNVDPTRFKMTIFNRWNNVIFETTDIQQGWNGRAAYNDELVPNDMYIYVMEFYDAAGNQLMKRGEVYVIR
jgi:gliding motility-associated-like protein